MEKFNRGERRFQTARLKAKRKSYRSTWTLSDPKRDQILKENPDVLGKVVQYPCRCSCAMCANGSKLFGNQANGKHVHELSVLEMVRKGLA